GEKISACSSGVRDIHGPSNVGSKVVPHCRAPALAEVTVGHARSLRDSASCWSMAWIAGDVTSNRTKLTGENSGGFGDARMSFRFRGWDAGATFRGVPGSILVTPPL